MASGKTYRKKLTACGGGVCVLTGFAAVISCAAAAGDIIAKEIYNSFYSSRIDYFFANGMREYAKLYGTAITMAALSVIMFVWALTSAKAKRMGREFAVIGIIMPVAVCGSPLYETISLAFSDKIAEAFASPFDGDKFRAAVELMMTGLPSLSGALLILAGIIAAVRLGGETFKAKVPAYSENSQTSDAEPEEYSNPQGFMNKKLDNNGITGETKPRKPEDPSEFMPKTKKPTVSLCPKCGEIVHADELFCANCGQKMI